MASYNMRFFQFIVPFSLMIGLALTPCVSKAELNIIQNEKITAIKVSPLNADAFAIKTGGSSVCSGQWVVFNADNFASAAAFDRAYSMVLSVMSSRKRVYVSSRIDNDCASAYVVAILE